MYIHYSGCEDGKVAIWKLTGTAYRQATIDEILKGHDGAIDDLYFSPDGRFLSSLDASGKIIIWCTQVSSIPMNEMFPVLNFVAYTTYRSGRGYPLRRLIFRKSMVFVGTQLAPGWPYRTRVRT